MKIQPGCGSEKKKNGTSIIAEFALPDNMLDHPALQAGDVDGEEGPGDEDEGVDGKDAGLDTP